jgi:hypothetical protein
MSTARRPFVLDDVPLVRELVRRLNAAIAPREGRIP